SIVAPAAQLLRGYTFFVPNNDSDKLLDRQERLTSKVSRPYRVCDGDTVHYLWAIDNAEEAGGCAHAELLCREARNLLALGWGIDQVVGNGRILTASEAAGLPGERWRAWPSYQPAAGTWRVPAPGSLDDLERVHRSFVNRVHGKR